MNDNSQLKIMPLSISIIGRTFYVSLVKYIVEVIKPRLITLTNLLYKLTVYYFYNSVLSLLKQNINF